MLKFYSLIVFILLFDGALLTFLAFAYHSERFAGYRISLKESMKVPGAKRLLNIAYISVLSLLALFGMTGALYRFTFYDHVASGWRIAY